MGMVVKNDISGINNARTLQMSRQAQQKSMEKLSSGNKINRSADDASGLSISEKMVKQIQSLNKAIDNAGDGTSMVQTADGAMNEVGDMLQRLNELAVQGANGTLTGSERAAVNDEANQILADIDRIGGSTKFNELHLMEGGSADVQAGADNAGSNRITVRTEQMNAKSLGIDGVNLSTAEGARAALTTVNDAIKKLSDQRSTLGATQNRMGYSSRNLQNVVENTTAAQSRVKDTDMASELIKKRRAEMSHQAGLAMMRQNNAARAAQNSIFNSQV
ncbi:MAG: flagellin [Lachnospiraceae bacterium]|nr:flagellin [Lachnospiraceae bacterium]